MILLVLALLASFIPSLLLFFYLRGNRGNDQDYRVNCRKCLIGGALCSFGVVLSSAAANLLSFFLGFESSSPIIKEAIHSFILAALSEELMKMWQTNKAINRDRARVSKLDVVSYAAIAGLGFGMLEDVVFMFSTSPGQIIVRGITMNHAAFGMIMGLLLAKGLTSDNKVFSALALLAPTLIHGYYDFDLGLNDLGYEWGGYGALIVTVLVVIFMIYMIFFYVRKGRKNEELTAPIFASESPEPEVPEDEFAVSNVSAIDVPEPKAPAHMRQ